MGLWLGSCAAGRMVRVDPPPDKWQGSPIVFSHPIWLHGAEEAQGTFSAFATTFVGLES